MAVVNKNVWKQPAKPVGSVVEVQETAADAGVDEGVGVEPVAPTVEHTPVDTPVRAVAEDGYAARARALDERLAAGRKRFSSKMSDETYEALRRAAFERDMQKQAIVEEVLHWALVEGNFDMRVFDAYVQERDS